MKPKFRAWFTKQQRMHVVESMEWIADGTAIRVYTEKYSNSGGTYSQWHEDTDRKTSLDGGTQIPAVCLMQSTGLKDKNGVEIYEGDILRIENTSRFLDGREMPCYSEVKIMYGHTYTWVDPIVDGSILRHGAKYLISGSADYIKMRGVATEDVEVIGNIYENPELKENIK